MRNRRIGRVRQVGLVAAMVGAFVATGCLATGCGDEPLTQPVARDRAASAVCDFAARCGNVGDGKTFPTLDACLTTWKGNIQNSWPPETCKKIVQAEYDVCINSIKTGVCQNGLDVLVILSKCGSAQVCTTM